MKKMPHKINHLLIIATCFGVAACSSDMTDLQEFAGSYYSRELDTSYYIESDVEQLKVSHQRHPDFSINLMGKDAGIANVWFFGQIKFVRNDSGEVTGMKVSNGRVQDLWFEKRG